MIIQLGIIDASGALQIIIDDQTQGFLSFAGKPLTGATPVMKIVALDVFLGSPTIGHGCTFYFENLSGSQPKSGWFEKITNAVGQTSIHYGDASDGVY